MDFFKKFTSLDTNPIWSQESGKESGDDAKKKVADDEGCSDFEKWEEEKCQDISTQP